MMPSGRAMREEKAELVAGEASGGPTRVQQVILAVTDHIRRQQLKVGDRLPGESHFAEALGVSRAVTREAFGALSALRVIDVGNGRVPRVRALDGAAWATSLGHAVSTSQVTVQQVWDVRRTIELRTVVLAAQNRSAAEAERILQHAAAMRRHRNNFELMTRHDIDMHRVIAEASHNLLFAQVVASFADLMVQTLHVAWQTRQTSGERTVVIQRHEAIAEAIRAGDPAAAEKAMDRHFDSTIAVLLNAGVR